MAARGRGFIRYNPRRIDRRVRLYFLYWVAAGLRLHIPSFQSARHKSSGFRALILLRRYSMTNCYPVGKQKKRDEANTAGLVPNLAVSFG